MTHASICSGIDGPALAASWLGWENLFHADINEFTNRILKYHYPNARNYNDIRKTDFTEWRGKVDVLSAGFPCQPFSVAGKRTGQDHDSYLWPETLRVVGEVRPRWFIGENVNGITSMVFPGEDVKVGSQTYLFGECSPIYQRCDRYIIDRICCDLEAIGYEVVPIVIPACAVEAPHERMRVFFLCHDSQNTLRDGLTSGRRQEEPNERQQRNAGTGDFERICCSDAGVANGGDGVAADGANPRAKSLQEPKNGSYAARLAAHPDGERFQKQHLSEKSAESTRVDRESCFGNIPGWRQFPTQPGKISRDAQSPFYCRNDGFPGRIHGITVSRWKRESIAALGNAIVPQVVYQIFRTIKEIENL